MKKMFKTMVSAICAVTMLAGSAVPVFAEEYSQSSNYYTVDNYYEFINEDGSYNYEKIQDCINRRLEYTLNQYGMLSGFYTLVNDDEGLNIVCRDIGCTKENGMASVLEDIEKIEKRFSTVYEDGKNYVILDGKKYQYGYGKIENPDSVSILSNIKWSSDMTWTEYSRSKDYNCYFATDMPAYMLPIWHVFDEKNEPTFRYIYQDNNGELTVVNPDAPSVDEILDLTFQFAKLQEEAVAFRDCTLFSDDDTIDDILTYEVYNDSVFFEDEKQKLEKYMQYGDVDSNGLVDVRDLAMIKRYLINDVEFTPAQKIISASNDSLKPDIRTVTKAARKIVKLED